MKPIIMFYQILIPVFVLFVAVSNLSAQVIVENGSRVNMYNRLDTAVNHAQAGDTLYLGDMNNNLGSGYNAVQISKELHIWAGINPDSSSASGISFFTGDIKFMKGSNNSSISGIYIDNIYIGNAGTDVVQNIDINRCYVSKSITFNTSLSYGTNILIRQNFVNQLYGNEYSINQFCTISNNVLEDIGYFGNNCVIANNVLLDSSGWYTNGGSIHCNNIFGCSNATIQNNICFSVLKVDTNQNPNCTFVNNLTVVKNKPCAACVYTNNIQQGKDSVFTAYTKLPDWANNKAQMFNFNFALKSICKGVKAGKDGYDLGIYGGLYPWKDGELPQNPHILSKTLSNKLDANGKLNVNIKAEAQQK